MRAPHEVLGIAPNATREDALSAYRRKEIYMNPKNFADGSEQQRQAEANMNELQAALDAFTSQTMPLNIESTESKKESRIWWLPLLFPLLGFLFCGKASWLIIVLLFFMFISVAITIYVYLCSNTFVNIICAILLGVGGYMLCSLPFGMFTAGVSLLIFSGKIVRNPHVAYIAELKHYGLLGIIVFGWLGVAFALMFVGVISAVYLNFIR